MIHLTIRTWRRIGDDGSEEIELGNIIDERDISLAEALELVIVQMMEQVNNVGTTIQRARSIRTAEQDMEVALSHEYYIGEWPPQNINAIPENWYAYWYSFTPSSHGSETDGDGALMSLYNAVVVYFLHLENSGAYLYTSPEFRRHIERKRQKKHFFAA